MGASAADCLITRRFRYKEITQVNRDLTDKKLRALKQLTPGTGTDGNEADPWVPEWLRSQSGQDNYRFLMSDKPKHDPDDDGLLVTGAVVKARD
ncbi:hypothetical protein MY3957_006342 [Beauveria namnaoensis]